MIRVKANLKTFEIRRAAYLSEVNRRFADLIQQAAHRWLRTVLMSPNGNGPIPIWSGASAATFTELAAAVAFPLGIVPSGSAPNRIAFGTKHGQGQVNTNPGKTFSFKYETTLPHLIFNEFNNANQHGFRLLHPGPYRFQQLGQAEFEAFAKRAQMPNPFSFLNVKQIVVT